MTCPDLDECTIDWFLTTPVRARRQLLRLLDAVTRSYATNGRALG